MTLPPLRRQVVVAADPDRAFAAFTGEIAAWWPLDRFACFEGATTVAFEGEAIVETGPDGSRATWGEVTRWEPGRRVGFTWHPGYDNGTSTDVEVTFTGLADGRTLVALAHTGWERLAEPLEARAEYRSGWPGVLASLASLASLLPAVPAGSGEVWLALEHTVAPGVVGSVFSQPLFAAHVAFLESLADDGLLVAAGPLGDTDGDGMTVVRVPADRVAALVTAAEADGSVAGGLLDVRVRPWAVRFTG